MKQTWTKRQKKITGIILGIASDKRTRVSMEDQIKWLEDKLKEVRRLAKKLPRAKWDGKKF